MHSLRLFGGVQLANAPELLGGRAAQRKRLALLGLLAIGSRTISRDRLIGLLWPDADEEGARHLLASGIYDLRRALGDDTIVAAGDDLRLNPRRVTVDVWDFEDALHAQDWPRAASVYGGALMEGLFVSGAAEFDRYIEQERDRYARAWMDALEKSADLRENAGDPRAGLPYLHRLVQAEPLSSRLALRLMSALVAAGERAAAIRHARTYESRVRAEEIGPPDPAVAAFAARLSSEVVATPSAPPAPAVAAETTPQPERGTPTQRPSRTVARRPWIPTRAVITAVAVVLVTIAGLVTLAGRPDNTSDLVAAGALPEVPAIIVGDFSGTAGLTDEGRAVREWLRTDLSQSPHLRALPQRAVANTLVRMEQDPETPLETPLALEVARRAGAAGALSGEIAPLGDGYVLTATLTRVDGAELLHAREMARDRSGLLDAVAALSVQVRRALGESRASLRASRPLPQVTTRSVEALLLYGRTFRPGLRHEDMIALLRQALEYDSTFAMAYRRLAGIAENSGQAVTAAYYARKAFEHSDKLPEPERSYAIATYRDYVMGDRPGAIAILRGALERYPRNVFFHSYHADLLLRERRWEDAEKAAPAEIEIVPSSYSGHNNLMYAQLGRQRFDDARVTLDAADSLPHAERLFLELHYAEATRDLDAAARWLDSLEAQGETEPFHIWSHRMDFALAQGRLAEARRIAEEELLEPAQRLAALSAIGRVRLRLLGDTAMEIAAIESALRRDPIDSIAVADRPHVALAEFFADAGGVARARRHLAAFEASPAFDPIHPAAAAILRAERRYDAAEQAYELLDRRGSPAECTHRYAFELGDTRERAGDVRGAIRAYEQGIAGFGCQYRDYALGTAYLSLRRLYARSGDADRSRRYESALRILWREADPGLARRLDAGAP